MKNIPFNIYADKLIEIINRSITGIWLQICNKHTGKEMPVEMGFIGK